MAVDFQTVSLQGTYRIGFKPPAERSLAAGELYIEVGAGAPKLWVGSMEVAGMVGNRRVAGTNPDGKDVPGRTRNQFDRIQERRADDGLELQMDHSIRRRGDVPKRANVHRGDA